MSDPSLASRLLSSARRIRPIKRLSFWGRVILISAGAAIVVPKVIMYTSYQKLTYELQIDQAKFIAATKLHFEGSKTYGCKTAVSDLDGFQPLTGTGLQLKAIGYDNLAKSGCLTQEDSKVRRAATELQLEMFRKNDDYFSYERRIQKQLESQPAASQETILL